jgi:hypothetical protein
VADTRFKEGKTEYISPVNRFYGSTMFAPTGKGLSKRGYTPAQEPEALCTDLAENGCPDPCAYTLCNEGMSFTVQCPDNCFQAAGVVYGADWGPMNNGKKNKQYSEGQTIYDSGGRLGPYEDTSAICRAAILSGRGTNDDSFYTTFTIVKPLRRSQDPGGGQIAFDEWNKADDCEGTCPGFFESERQAYVSKKCCRGGWPPQLGYEINRYLKYRNGFKNEWQNVRAFVIEGAVKNLCPTGFTYKKGSRQAGDPECVVSAKKEFTPVQGCDECVEGDILSHC